jgi:hypothetical protein
VRNYLQSHFHLDTGKLGMVFVSRRHLSAPCRRFCDGSAR